MGLGPRQISGLSAQIDPQRHCPRHRMESLIRCDPAEEAAAARHETRWTLATFIAMPALLDHPFDHPDDPTGAVWSRLDRRRIQRDQARSVWSRPSRRRAPLRTWRVGARIPRGAANMQV